MRKSIGILLSLLLIFTFLMASCTPAAPEVAATDVAATEAPVVPTKAQVITAQAPPTAVPTDVATEVVPTIKRGGRLTYSRGVLALMMDTKETSALADVFIMRQIFEPLIEFDTLKNEYVGVIADEFSVSDDGLEYSFHIRDGVLFNDGTPVTAEDVKFTFELAQVEGVWTELQKTVQEVVAVDAQNVKMILTTPTAPFLDTVAQYSNWIISKAGYEAAPDKDTFYANPVTTGPFMLKEWVVGDHMLLVRNPHYWRLGEDGEPLPYVDEVYFTQVAEDTSRILQVQSESVDGTDGITWSNVNNLKDDPVGDIKTWESNQTYYVFINHQRPPFDDLNVRLAINYAIDRQVMVDTALEGYGVPAHTFTPLKDPCKDQTEYWSYDVEKAKELIAASKYPDGYTGCVISVPQGRVVGIDNATMAIDYWSKIGINCTIEQVETGILSQRARETDIDAISGYQWTSGSFDLDQQMNWFIITPTFYGNYVNEASQQLVRDAATEVDPVKRCDMYKQVQKNFAEDGANVVLYHSMYNTFISKDVKNYYLIPSYRLDFAQVWLDR